MVLKEEKAAGKQYVLVEGSYWMEEIGNSLLDSFDIEYWEIGELSEWRVWLNSIFNKNTEYFYRLWGKESSYENCASRSALKLEYIDLHSSLRYWAQ